MSETEGGIVINGAIANKALESLRKFAASSRNGKIGIGGKLETVLTSTNRTFFPICAIDAARLNATSLFPSLGCVLVNLLGAVSGANILGPLDIVFGSAATLLAGFLSYALRDVRIKGLPLLSALMPVLANGIVVGLELTFVISGGFNLSVFLVNAAQVALGEAIACFVLGLPMVRALEKTGLGKKLFSDRVEHFAS